MNSQSQKLAALLVVTLYNCLFLPKLELGIHLDRQVHQFFISHHNAVLDFIMNAFSFIGSSYGFVFFLCAYLILFFINQGSVRTAIMGIVIFSLLKLGNYWLKLLFARPRPETAIGIHDTYSMPSGHAANAALMLGVLIILVKKSQLSVLKKLLIYLISFAIIVGIASSRLYLGVHYLSDVIMGTLWTAIALALLSISYPEIFMLRKASH